MGHVGQQELDPPAEEAGTGLDPRIPRPLRIPIPDDKLADLPYFAGRRLPEMKYLHERRAALGATCRAAAPRSTSRPRPQALDRLWWPCWNSTAEGREISTTQAFVRILNQVLRELLNSAPMPPC